MRAQVVSITQFPVSPTHHAHNFNENPETESWSQQPTQPNSRPPTANELFASWWQKDKVAGEAIYQSYQGLVCWAIQNSLPQQLRHRLDTEDLVQVVFLALLKKGKENLLQWANDLSFRCWLVKFTRHHVWKETRRHFAARRDPRREVSLHEGSYKEFARENPAEEGRHQIQDLYEAADAIQERIVDLIAQGCSRQETAEQVGLSTRTVLRKLNELRVRVAAQDTEEDRHRQELKAGSDERYRLAGRSTWVNMPRDCSSPGEMASA